MYTLVGHKPWKIGKVNNNLILVENTLRTHYKSNKSFLNVDFQKNQQGLFGAALRDIDGHLKAKSKALPSSIVAYILWITFKHHCDRNTYRTMRLWPGRHYCNTHLCVTLVPTPYNIELPLKYTGQHLFINIKHNLSLSLQVSCNQFFTISLKAKPLVFLGYSGTWFSVIIFFYFYTITTNTW